MPSGYYHIYRVPLDAPQATEAPHRRQRLQLPELPKAVARAWDRWKSRAVTRKPPVISRGLATSQAISAATSSLTPSNMKISSFCPFGRAANA
jgi:hypothetical protein